MYIYESIQTTNITFISVGFIIAIDFRIEWKNNFR